MTADPIQIYKDKSGAYIIQHQGKRISSSWDREYAESALCFQLSQLQGEQRKVIGSWDT